LAVNTPTTGQDALPTFHVPPISSRRTPAPRHADPTSFLPHTNIAPRPIFMLSRTAMAALSRSAPRQSAVGIRCAGRRGGHGFWQYSRARGQRAGRVLAIAAGFAGR